LAARVLYKSSVSHDLKKITPRDKQRILRQIDEVLGRDPRSGEALRGEFEGLLKLRVGEYRVVYALVGPDVLVLRVRHRSKAYG
jgi:mRNA interferase RelE/StbE